MHKEQCGASIELKGLTDFLWIFTPNTAIRIDLDILFTIHFKYGVCCFNFFMNTISAFFKFSNALIDKQVRASVTNFPRILNKLQGFGEDKQEFLDKLSRYDLLVIDDLGVERDTSYSVEQVFNVIDARSRTGKPLIVTTNLSLADLQNPSSLGYARIYDRILEMCPIRLKLAGDSRRTQNAQERRDKAKRLLGLERT